MTSTSQTLKRLGVATVGACTLLSTPYLGAVAFAGLPGAAPSSADVTITSQVTGNASPRNDGTDTTVTVSANVAYAASTATPADNSLAPSAVRFSYQASGSAVVVPIGTDSSAPYAVQWTPPVGGGSGYQLFAEALDANGMPYASAAKTTSMTNVVDAPTVHVVSRTTGYSSTNTIVVTGTRSADLPAIDLYTQVRDNATGELSPASMMTAAGTVDAGSPTNGGTQSWTTTATIPTPAANADVLITAIARGADATSTLDDSDDVAQGPLYAQALTTFTATPATATQPIAGTQAYTVTALDKTGVAIAGLDVVATDDGSGATITPDAGTATGTAGTVAFTGTAYGASQTFTFKTGGFTRSTKLTGYKSVPTVLTIAASPAKAVYESTNEFGQAAVSLCVTDQNGNGTPTSGATAPIVTRTHTDNNTSATNPATSVTFTPNPGSKSNCYDLSKDFPSGTSGSDTFKAYFNNDGTPGYDPTFTSGFGSADVAAAPFTLKYADLSITALNTQSKKGTPTTVSFKVLGTDLTPFAGRKITLTTGTTATSGFTATQPAGTTKPVGSTVIATTDANGIASAIVNSLATTTPGTVSVVVNANDDIGSYGNFSTGGQIGTGQPASATVEFRDAAVALTTLTPVVGSTVVTSPGGSYNSTSVPRPGDVLQTQYTLTDINGGLLVNLPVVLSLDHGFFTKACAATPNTEVFANCDFTTAPVAGAPVGSLNPIAAPLTAVSDAFGVITVNVAIGRDAAFDTAGVVKPVLTAVANGGTAAPIEVAEFSTNGINPANGGNVSVVPTSALRGDIQQSASVPFAVRVLDGFGNLVKLTTPVQLTVVDGELSAPTTVGSFLGDPADALTLTSPSTSTTGTPAVVTATYTAPITSFHAQTAPPAAADLDTVGTTASKTGTLSANFYAVDLQKLSFAFASTPADSVVVNTPVTSSVTITDQKGKPVQGLLVNFLRTGAIDTSATTNAAGKAGTSFSSGTVGTVMVTGIVTDRSGNELGRGSKNIAFTAPVVTAPAAAPAVDGHSKRKVAKKSLVVLTGTGTAGSTVYLHFHKAGTPADDYSIVRAVVVSNSGVWVRRFLAKDYRLFVSNSSDDTLTQASTFLIQAR